MPEVVAFDLNAALRPEALGGRSLRLLEAEAGLFTLACLLDTLFAEGGRFVFVAFAATTFRPLKTPGFGLAATLGCPWFTDASCARLVLAVCSCSLCALVA